MRKINLKFAIGLLALIIGIAIVWASNIHQNLFSVSVAETSAQKLPITEKSGKILINFKDFEHGKGWLANFEIVNETSNPILYVGSMGRDSFGYCTLAVKHEEPFPANADGKIDNLSVNIRDNCYYSTGMFLQTLEPGDSVILSAWEYEVRALRYIKDSKQETSAQIGFEFFVGDEKQREILWSEEITFPNDENR